MSRKRELFTTWMAQVRGNFLVLSVLLVAIGLALAGLQMKTTGEGTFRALHALLLVLGVVLAHTAVNLFNEYSDYQTGIDARTTRTPFSGGSGMLQAGATSPAAVATAAWHSLFFAFLIGLYFAVMSHWVILPIMAIGAASIVWYTRYMARWLMGEFFAGLSLGSLVVIGAYIAMIGTPGAPAGPLFTRTAVMVSVPPGILTALLLFLNQFPDMEADREGGRFHLVILLGRKRSAVLYCAGLAAVYASIIAVPALGLASWWLLLACATLPIAVKAGITALRHPDDMGRIVPAQGMNVVVVLATDLLLAVAILIQALTA